MRWGKGASEIIRVKLKFKKRHGGIIAQIPRVAWDPFQTPAFWLPYLSKTFLFGVLRAPVAKGTGGHPESDGSDGGAERRPVSCQRVGKGTTEPRPARGKVLVTHLTPGSGFPAAAAQGNPKPGGSVWGLRPFPVQQPPLSSSRAAAHVGTVQGCRRRPPRHPQLRLRYAQLGLAGRALRRRGVPRSSKLRC